VTADGRGPRRARIESDVAAPATVAAAIAPDDTDDIHTRVEDGAVVATIGRPSTASLQATIDDYVVALGVATAVADAARGESDASSTNRHADTH